MHKADVLILGSGTAGQMTAYAAAKAGRSVVVVENGPPGGVSANRGCDAVKPLVHAAETLHRFRASRGAGLAGSGRLDWGELRAFQRAFTEPVPELTRRDLARAGVRLVEGEPCFTGPGTLRVGEESFAFQKAAVCTGRVPRPLGVPGAELALDPAGFLGLDALPERVVFVGGGDTAMELAGVAALAGSRVTVVEAGPRPMTGFDEDAVRVVVRGVNEAGVRVLTDRRVSGIERAGEALCVQTADGSTPLGADLVVACFGQVPAVAGLGLEAAGIEHGPGGIRVDEQLRTTNERVWAGGSVADTGNPPLPAVAARDGRVLRRNLSHDGQPRTHLRADPPRVTAAAFTLPTAARTGFTEAQARAREDLGAIEVASGDAGDWKLLRQQRAGHAWFKFVYAGSDATRDRRLVGAHLVGPGAEEAINLFATGLHDPAATARLADTAAAYPSFGFNLLNAFRAGL